MVADPCLEVFGLAFYDVGGNSMLFCTRCSIGGAVQGGGCLNPCDSHVLNLGFGCHGHEGNRDSAAVRKSKTQWSMTLRD